MGYSCAQVTGWTTSFVTISLSVDYVGAAEIGQWLAVESEVIKTGSTICFAQCLIKADDAVIARASGTFRVVPKKGSSRSGAREARTGISSSGFGPADRPE